MLCAIPIEIANRELDGVIYLALHLAARGLPTLFGERMVTQYVKHNDKPVLYFDIEQYAPMNRKVLKSGGLVFNLNAEGFAFLCDPDYISIFENVRGNATKVCLFGRRQQEAVSAALPDFGDGVFQATGHPSFDLAMERFAPYYRNETIIREHGDGFILVNLNNGIFNHAMGLEPYLKMLQKMDEWKLYADENYLKFLYKQADYQRRVAESMIELIRHLSTVFPERKIVVRPHPTENNLYYVNALKGCPNAVVDNTGTVREWIASAGTVIHHDCTTSLEALLMGCSVIQYSKVLDMDLNDNLLATIGIPTTSPEAVEEIIRKGGLTDVQRREQLDRLEPSLANISGSASARIAELAASMAPQVPETWIPDPLGFWGAVKCWRKYVSKLIRARQPGRNGKKVRYALGKFPRLPLSEVIRRVDSLRAIDPALPEVDLTSLTLNTFLMRPRRG